MPLEVGGSNQEHSRPVVAPFVVLSAAARYTFRDHLRYLGCLVAGGCGRSIDCERPLPPTPGLVEMGNCCIVGETLIHCSSKR